MTSKQKKILGNVVEFLGCASVILCIIVALFLTA